MRRFGISKRKTERRIIPDWTEATNVFEGVETTTKEELIALGLTEEQASTVPESYNGYVPKSRFDEVNNTKKHRTYRTVLFLDRQLPILPERLHSSTFGVWGLNYCVRHGNRWDPSAIITGFFFKNAFAPSKLHRSKFTAFFPLFSF